MEIYHKLEKIDGSEQLVIYVKYPDEYEFSLDFNSMKKNVANVADRIREYAFKNLGKISDNTALLVLNGVILGTLAISQLAAPKTKTINESATKPTVEISQVVDEHANKETSNVIKEEVEALKTEEKIEEVKPEENTTTSTQTSNVNKTTTSSSKTQSNTVNKNTSTNTQKPSNNNVSKPSNNSGSNNSSSTSTPSNNQTTNNGSSTSTSIPSQNVRVRLASGEVLTLTLEDYVVGVVASEMPASFHTEALKAQSIAARTYALKKTSSGAILSATVSDQVYSTDAQLRQKWGGSYNTYYNKVRNAVIATKGECLMYNGSYIEAQYFSTSNGRTEDAVNVWGNSFPYLKSVESSWDVGVSGYTQTKTIPMSEISTKLGVNLTSISQISINSKTEGNRVKSITVCDKEFTGVKIRQLLGLRSADFDISVSGNSIVFTTRGYGHGVGMSQYGANNMAKAGYSYSQILKHYYTGVSIVKK